MTESPKSVAKTMKKVATKGGDVNNIIESLSEETKEKALSEFWRSNDTSITYSGKHIVLPAIPVNMPPKDAITALQRRIDLDNQEVNISEFFEDYYAFEALTAFIKAMERLHGWCDVSATSTFFGEIKPRIINVRVGPNPEDVIQAPLGSMNAPGITKPIETGIHRGKFYIQATVKMNERKVITDIIEETKRIIREHSIYRSRALSFKVADNGKIPEGFEPTFIDLSKVDPSELIHNKETLSQIEISLWAPIENTERCREHKIPLKSLIMLEGEYGTGKTMTAHVTAKKCVQNGWTFIMIDDARGLAGAIEFASRYQPSCVFCEDIDRAVGSERTDEVNMILNEVDGLIKDREIMIITTTNHIGKIHSGMLRPGRTDSIISVLPPDKEAAERFIRLYSRGFLHEDEDISGIAKAVTGVHGSSIRGMVEQAKRYAMIKGIERLKNEHYMMAWNTMKRHYAMVYGEKEKAKTPEEIATQVLMNLFRSAAGLSEFDKKANGIGKMVEDIHNAVM